MDQLTALHQLGLDGYQLNSLPESIGQLGWDTDGSPSLGSYRSRVLGCARRKVTLTFLVTEEELEFSKSTVSYRAMVKPNWKHLPFFPHHNDWMAGTEMYVTRWCP